jgi:hypothetical protein
LNFIADIIKPMTIHSHYWKKDLIKRADTLADKVSHKRWGEEALMILEKVVVLGFYTIQKLHQENLLSDSLKNRKIKLTQFNAKPQCTSILRITEIAELYDLEIKNTNTHNLLFLSHQFLHSRIIEFYYDKDKHPIGIYVTSDHNKSKMIFKIDFSQIIEVFEQVGEDSLSKI